MKTSCKWLKDYVDFSWDPAALADALTMAGLEVEGMQHLGVMPAGVVVAQILSRQPHPGADKLSLCQVDDGSGTPQRVVCGAPNCDAGQKVPFARLGTQIGEMKIKKAKIRGEESFGMLCSAQELGLPDATHGLLILPADAPLGLPLGEYLGTDTVIDWEVTPNRPDWLSHLGIAREIAALTSAPWRTPAAPLRETPGTDIHQVAKVTVSAPDLCPRYLARVIRGVRIAPSPAWLQDKLRAVGLRSINNVVDITNFVLLEYGQPLHAFDYDKLADHHIIVRRAAAGEALATLDGKTHTLTPNQLVIADAERGVALAGVMGGGNSEISDTTTTVLLESAAFHPGNIRATARDLGVSTDSSYRFARGVDIEGLAAASARACQLICDLAGGELLAGTIDVRVGPYVPPRVYCRYARVDALLGVTVPPADVDARLTRLGLTLARRDDTGAEWLIPSHRLDLKIEADLIEEVARLYPLDQIPAAAPRAVLGGVRADDTLYPLQALRTHLSALGLHECLSYPLISQAQALHGTGLGEAALIGLKNPISQDFSILRPSLIPSILATVAHNLARDTQDLRVYELGKAYAKDAALPEERLECVIALTGTREPELYGKGAAAVVDLSDLRAVLDGLLTACRLTGWSVRPGTHAALQPGRSAELVAGDTVIGVFGQAAPALVTHLRLKHPLFLAILQVGPLLAAPTRRKRFTALPQFPAVARDVAFAAPEELTHQQVLAEIATMRLPILASVEPVDLYRDEQALGAGRKSLAYRLIFRSPERTLTDTEVNTAHERVRQRLGTALGVELR